jgi:hypothetical protein
MSAATETPIPSQVVDLRQTPLRQLVSDREPGKAARDAVARIAPPDQTSKVPVAAFNSSL